MSDERKYGYVNDTALNIALLLARNGLYGQADPVISEAVAAARVVDDQLATLRAEIATLRAERDALVPVARLGFWALSKTRGEHYQSEVETGDIQIQCVRLSAAEWRQVAPIPCGAFCTCDEEWSPFCLRDTDATTQARAVLDALMVGP